MHRLLVISICFLLGFSIKGIAQCGPDKICLTQKEDSVGLYNISYHIIDYNFSGLLLYKKINDSCYRAVITSEMGPKILDMYLFEKEYKLNYAIKQLKRKIIVKSFYSDLVSVSGLNCRNKPIDSTVIDSSLSKMYIIEKNSKLAYSCNANNMQSQAVYMHKDKKEVVIDYFYSNLNSQVDSIFLKHFNYKMEMELRKIKF